MNLEVEVIRRAVRDLHGAKQEQAESSLRYLNSESFIKDCKCSAIDSDWVKSEVYKAMREEGARRKYLINRLSNELINYS